MDNHDFADIYFKSIEHKIIFALLYTDSVLRERLLGISEKMYINKDEAKNWRNVLAKLIHPDVCKIDGTEEAIKKLNEFYERMTEDDGDEES